MISPATLLVASASLLTSVSAHGFITSPQPRLAGDAMKAACGEQVYNNQASDTYGNIQGELQVAATQTDYNAAECNIWLCKGFKYADNTANVQSFTTGQVVPFTFDVRAPHTGYTNVSIVNTATNSIIGSPLITYDDFGDNSKTIPANETSFSITVPEGLESTCATAGACVVQHYWNAESIDQTYESCVDFVIGGGSSSGSSSVVGSAVASSTAVVASSSAAAIVASSTQAAGVTSPAVAMSSAAPATLQTVVKSSSAAVVATSTSAAAAAATEAPADEGEDEC